MVARPAHVTQPGRPPGRGRDGRRCSPPASAPPQPDLANSVRPGPDLTKSGEQLPAGHLLRDARHPHRQPYRRPRARHGRRRGSPRRRSGCQAPVRPGHPDAGDPLLSEPDGRPPGLPGAIAAGIRYAVGHGAQRHRPAAGPWPASIGHRGTGAHAPVTPLGPRRPRPGAARPRRRPWLTRCRQGVLLVAPGGRQRRGQRRRELPGRLSGSHPGGAFNRLHESRVLQPSVVRDADRGRGAASSRPTEPAGYATMNSTGAASAIVAGIAALIKSRFPGLSPAQVRRALDAGTRFRRPGGIEDGSGYGAANAARALTRASVIAGPLGQRPSARATAQRAPTPPPVPSTAIEPGHEGAQGGGHIGRRADCAAAADHRLRGRGPAAGTAGAHPGWQRIRPWSGWSG